MSNPGGKGQDEFKSAVTMTVVWVAGLTLVIIFAAIFAGLWLDKVLDIKPLFTIVLVILSIPLTLFLTFRVVKTATTHIQPDLKKESVAEDPHLGKNH